MKQSTFSAVIANKLLTVLQGYTKGIRFTAILTILFTLGVGSMLGAEKTITLTYGDFGLTTSYAQKTATVDGVGFTVNQGYKGSGDVIQMNSTKGAGVLYNTTSIAGLKSITVNVSSGSKTYTITSGTAQTPSGNSQTGTTTKTFFIPSGDTYFQLKVSGASYFSSIVITYDDGNSGGGSDGCPWELVTDASSLAAGDAIVIAAKDYNFAISTNQGSNNRGQAAITKSGNTIAEPSSSVQVLTLKTGKVSNSFAFYTGSGYLYAASSSSNYLRTENTLSNNSSWTISIAANGTATLKANGTNSRNVMQYNQSSSLFACYASASQKALVIYKEVCAEETDCNKFAFSADLNTTYECNINDNLTLTVDAQYDSKASNNITYQWYSNTTNSTTGGTVITGSTSASYQPSTDALSEKYYYCVASYKGECEITSKVAWVKTHFCDNYTFHTGGDGVKETNTPTCFTQVSSTTEWQITNYTIPSDTKFFVGKQGWWYDALLGNNNSRSVAKTWSESMYLAPSMDASNANGSPKVGQATGAVGTLRIFDDSNWDNLYVGFIPNGYKLKFGTTEYAFTHKENSEYLSDIVEYNATSANYNASAGITNVSGDYVATDHTQEMRHIFVKDNIGWRNDGAKLAIYYWNGSTNGWCGFLKTVPGDATLFEGWIPASYTSLKFVRFSNTKGAVGDWNDKWNETGDLTISSGNNLFTITDWGTGSWSAYSRKGKFRIYNDSKDKNWYLHFYPHNVLIYDANSGSGTMASQSVPADATSKSVTVSANGFTRSGYRFTGWNTKADGSGTPYAAGASLNLTSDITLYAQWAQEFTVTYNANGGTTDCEDDNTYIQDETVIVCSTNPSQTGYTFKGWSDGTNTYNASGTFLMPANNVTLIAQWQINSYTVTWDPNGGNWGGSTENKEVTYNYGAAITTPADPTREDYQFDGWHNGTSIVTPATTMPASNLTYTAQWTPTYTITWLANGQEFHKQENAVEGTVLDLPDSEPDAATYACDDKVFVGWTANPISGNTDDEPADLFTTKTAKVEDAATTYYAVFATAEGGGTENLEATLSFADKAQRTTYTTSQQVWEQNGITLTNDKASSTSNVGDYSDPARFYKSSDITIEAPGNITQIEFNCVSGYVISVTGATTSGTTVTVTLDGTSDTYTIKSLSAQVRLNSVVVNYTTGNGTSYSDYTTVCEAIPDPVWGGAVINRNSIKVDCGSMTKLNAADPNGPATISFPAATNHTLTYDITVTASEGFLVSTNKTDADKYGASVTVSPNKTGDNAGKITQNVYVVAVAPAMSDEDFTGTVTLSGKQLAENQVIDVTADVTCTTYTLTLDDRGTKTTAEYYAGASVPKPADPEGVCTDPINYVFDGWSLDPVTDENTTSYEKVTFPFEMPADKKTLYAVYRWSEAGGGDGDYHLVEKALDDWSGDYLIAYSNTIFADGRIGGKDEGIGALGVQVDLSSDILGKAIPASVGDEYNVTLEAITGGYLMKTKDGQYNYQSSNESGLSSTENKNVASKYPIVVDFVSSSDVKLCITNAETGSLVGPVFHYNTTSSGYFRFYKNGGMQPVYLYKKSTGTTLYTTSPVCGPHLVITEGKDIYVTGGNAGAARDLVMASQKVSYQATRLKTQDGSPEGTAPDVKVATNGITKGGVVTTEVKVTFENTVKELQPDDTYTITGDIVVTYEADANNMQEDIQVQLAVDYPANADARDNFIVHARSLPSEFVIVAKSGDKWYALNADMSSSKAQPANGQVTLNDLNNPTEATFAPCNAIYTFEAMPQGAEDRKSVRFIGMENKYLWSASEGNTGIQNNSKNPTADALAYNWKLYTEDNITYHFGNAQNTRMLGLHSTNVAFGMYANGASVVQDIRILPYVEKCIYNYAPTNLIVTDLKGTHVTLTWDGVVGATKYQYSDDATNWTDCGTEPTVTITGLRGGTNYTYYIRAYHEDTGVSNECIDYEEITFTTADCDDVPTNISYSADLSTITVIWTASSATSTVKLYSDKEGTTVLQTIEGTNSVTFEGLIKNTQYYVQVFGGGSCASAIIPAKTKDVEMDVVEWMEQGIIVDVNTNEKIGVTLENEVAFGTGVGKKAEDIFFSKYFEANGTAKILAIYNGTDEKIDLSTVSILNDLSSQSLDLAEFGHKEVGYIYPNEEIILFNKGVEAVTECSEQQDSYPDWYNVEHGVLNFGGRATLILKRGDAVIDIIGSIETKGTNYPNDLVGTTIYNIAKSPTGENEKPSWGDDPGWVCESGDNIMTDVEETDYPLSTNRCLLVRKNTVVSGVNAVTNNIDKVFATLCDEWVGLQIPKNAPSTDKGVTESCEGMAFVGDFDYSSYYTQYVPIGGETTFEENQRNPDGTLTVPITDLYKQACRNIKVTLKDEHNEVIMTREYKVPIMITTDQATAYTEANKDDNAFYALQYNLATIEVDENGDEIARYPLTIEQVREICKTCDVVIRDSATLTKAADDDANDHPQVNNVFIYEGASLVIPDGTNETITSLSLRRKGDIVASAKVEEGGNLHLPASATAPIYLDMRVDANNWHWFTLPYNCNIADVTWVDGTPAQYNKDWFIMYYDGNSRANEQSIYENHWKVYNGTTIEAGKGYIVGIKGNLSKPDYTFELRFPMATEVLTKENGDKKVPVNAWGIKDDITPNKKGWNLVGNPYLDYYQPSTSGFKGLPLIKYTNMDPVTGEWHYDDSGEVPFIVTPVNGGWYEYKQELASEVEMMPFTAYFVQVGNPKIHENGAALNAEFIPAKRGRASLIQRAANEVDEVEEPAIVAVSLTNSKGESDKTTLIIDDRFTSDYEMNADFFKWFGDYYKYYTKPVLYSVGADAGKRAFNALSEQLAAQPIPLGMFAAQAGDYTFTLTRKRCDLSSVEEVWLYDATNGTYTNLMQSDYTFQTAKTEGEGRFYLSVKLRRNAPTDITDIYGGNIVTSAKDGQIIVGGLTDNTQLWIYDATGKLLHTEQTTNFQHVYEVPVVGTYFVRTQLAGQAQTIKVLVE